MSDSTGDRLVDFQRLRKETPSYDLYSYGFGNYPTKNKLYRDYMDLFIKLPLMECVPVCGFVVKRYIRIAK